MVFSPKASNAAKQVKVILFLNLPAQENLTTKKETVFKTRY
jgi:hypothetical protein